MDLRLYQFWIIFLLLMAMSCGGYIPKKTKRRQHIVPPDCKHMLIEPTIFQRWCVGTYPWLVSVKFLDRIISIGEPYALYLPRAQDSILVLYKRSPFHKCRNLVFKDSNTFFCLDRDLNETITVKDAAVHCMPFHSKMSDDLMNECLKQNEYQHKNEYLMEVLRTRRCILHYTLGEHGSQPLQMPIILLIIAVILQFN